MPPITPISTGGGQVHQTTGPNPTSPSDIQTRPSAEIVRPASNPGGLPTRVSPSTSPSASRVSLPPMPSRTPGAGSSSGQTPLRQSENFLLGIKEDAGKATAFAAAAQGGHAASLQFIADNVNPNLAYGSLLNAGKALLGGHMALKQNCVYCAKAADQNLEALASGNATSFWAADKTSAGTLPPQGSVDKGLRPDDSVARMLTAEIGQGRRGIISVPQRDTPSYSHAMNVVHAEDGSVHVIDGQNSKVYDLSKQEDHQAFDTKFGHNGGPCVARFFETGAAPRPPAVSDDWVRVS